MRILAFAIGAALAAPPASSPVLPDSRAVPAGPRDSSLQSEVPPTTESAAKPAPATQAPVAPGPDVMKPLPAPQERCLSARCATV
ncbi:MAG: hypothetical protein R3F61_26365 [Myxococcota bacterium]